MTATRMGEIAQALGAERGFGVEVFDRDQLVEMGCGGLLGVNGGSVEEPRMIKLTYRPDGAGTTPRTSVWSARGSCTTPAASASSPPTAPTPP